MKNILFRKQKMVMGIIAIVYFAILLYFADGHIMWMDDVAQIGMVNHDSFSEFVKDIIASDNTPPVSHIIDFFWLKYAPYSARWIKVPSILFGTLGVFFIGLVASEIVQNISEDSNKEISSFIAGISAMSLAMANEIAIKLGHYTFRSYGMFYGISAITLYLFILQRDDSSKRIKYLVSIWFLIMTHYFGCLIVLCLAIIDLIETIVVNGTKKEFWRRFIQYTVVLLLYVPWIIAVAASSLSKMGSFFLEKPTISGVIATWLTLNAQHKLWVLLAVVSIIALIAKGIIDKGARKNSLVYAVTLCIPYFVFAIVFAFSTFAVSHGMSSLWKVRYFVGLIPYFAVAGGILFGIICNFAMEKIELDIVRRNASILAVLFGCLILVYGVHRLCIMDRDTVAYDSINLYEQSLYYLAEQDDINNDDVIVLTRDYEMFPSMKNGFAYVIHQEYPDVRMDNFYGTLVDKDISNVRKAYVVNLNMDNFEYDIDSIKNLGLTYTESIDNLPIDIYEMR